MKLLNNRGRIHFGSSPPMNADELPSQVRLGTWVSASRPSIAIAKHTVSTRQTSTHGIARSSRKRWGRSYRTSSAIHCTRSRRSEVLQLPEAQTYAYSDEDLAEEAPEIMEALRELREVWKSPFPSHPQSPPRPSALIHHDLTSLTFSWTLLLSR